MQAARDSACPDNKVTVRIVNPDVMPVHPLTTFDETREASTGDNESASSLSGRIVTTTVMELFSWEYFFFKCWSLGWSRQFYCIATRRSGEFGSIWLIRHLHNDSKMM
jgi:hypothetical protein